MSSRIGKTGWSSFLPDDTVSRAVVVHLAGQTIFAGLALVWAVVVARSLGVVGKGAVSAVLLFCSLFASVGILGTRDGIAYHVGKHGSGIAAKLIRVCALQAVVVAILGTLGLLAMQMAGVASLQ